MSSVGFTVGGAKEIEKLREAYQSMNDCLRSATDAEACIEIMNFGRTGCSDGLRRRCSHAGDPGRR